MIVIDASAVLEVLLRTAAAGPIEARLFLTGETLHAPHLLDVEVTQVLRRYVAGRQIAEPRARQALDDLAVLPLARYPHSVLLPRVWALRENMTAYDAVYVALAEALRAPFITRDRRLAAAPGHRARIEVL